MIFQINILFTISFYNTDLLIPIDVSSDFLLISSYKTQTAEMTLKRQNNLKKHSYIVKFLVPSRYNPLHLTVQRKLAN